MSPRIDVAEPPFSDEIQVYLDQIMPSGVPPLSLFKLLALDARLFKRFMAGSLLDRGNLTLRQREIVINRITAKCGSEYEWGVHVAFFGEKAGFTEAQLTSLVHGIPGDVCWEDPAERALISMCDTLNEQCQIGPDLWELLLANFSSEALVEIMMLCGQYRMVSYLTNAVNLELEPYAARFPVDV